MGKPGRRPRRRLLTPSRLDPPTVADDSTFLAAVSRETNLPAWLKNGLAALYPNK